MGACTSLCGGNLSEEERAAIIRNRKLQAQLTKEVKEESKKIKLLLLGAGESGKSTLFKQMRVNYGKAYTKAELDEQIPTVHKNVMENFIALLNYSTENAISLNDMEPEKEKFLKSYNASTPITPAIGEKIHRLWNNEGVQATWKIRSRLQLLDALEFYCENIARISSPKYSPTTEDYLLARVRSTGMIEQQYTIQRTDFVILDVGGQRSERRKWIQCFDNVTAIIFVAAINEYDQVLYEDHRVNRVVEAVKLFKNTLGFRLLADKPIILFLNKRDIFEKKLFEIPLRVVGERNEDFAGPYAEDAGVDPKQALEAAKNYMRDKFLTANENPDRSIYPFFTCATDSENVKHIFNATVNIVLNNAISDHFYGGS